MLKLLLADDSVTIHRLVQLTFSGEDVLVLTAIDGEQAIARIVAERPDIVLADIGMPKRSGYDVAAFVKGHTELARIPVLLLAGAFEPVDPTRAAEVKCDGVLVKPFEPQHVIARVKELVGGAKGSPTAAVADIPRPIERLTERPFERPRQSDSAADFHPKAEGASAARPRRPALDDSVGHYFDQLDAAFEHLGTSPREAPGGEGEQAPAGSDRLELPTLDRLLADVPPEKSGDNRNTIADAFAALLAMEEGKPGAEPVRLAPAAAEPVITDDLVARITQRVLERLAPDAVKAVVAPIVSEVAERLVREEIARIRAK